MEKILGDLRKLCYQGQIDKNLAIERAAKFLEEVGSKEAAEQVRKLKLETTLG